MSWRVIAGPYRNALHAIWTNEFDLVESSIVLQFGGLVRDPILIAHVGLDESQVFLNFDTRIVAMENPPAGLIGQLG
jgi:hypothetical protein